MTNNMYSGYNIPTTAFLADRRAQIERAIQFAEEERRAEQ